MNMLVPKPERLADAVDDDSGKRLCHRGRVSTGPGRARGA
jgi:hypothetical protein